MLKLAARRWLAAGLAAATLGLAATAVDAQERKISEIDPAVVQQGDTVLLTIKGENLPTGTVALEFFPQQIALLDILSASDTEVVAQIKVPSLVAPGPYNVLLYNHLGDEVFAEGLLTINSDIITPVFRDYDPKVIAEATKGFALLLTGESITQDAAAHLRMRWFQGERELPRLSTMFSPGGPGQMVCAVTGDLPAGKLQGRIYLDEKPIYLVEIVIESPTGLIVGHAPAQLLLEATPYELTIIGADLTQNYVEPIEVELTSAETVAKAREISLRDSATLQAVFSGPLPQGTYELHVVRLDDVIYSGQVELVQQAPARQAGPEIPESGAEEVPPPVEPPQDAGGELPAGPAVEFRIDSVAPQAIPANAKAASLVINGAGLGAGLAERLKLRLTFGEIDCDLLFIGAGGQSLTCLFAPPENGWPTGIDGKLTINDPLGELEEYVASLAVTPVADVGEPAADRTSNLPDAELELPIGPGGDERELAAWDVLQAVAEDGAGGSALSVILKTTAITWDPQLLRGSFTLLPDDPMLQQVFSNVTLAGQLTFIREDQQTAKGTCAGRFVPGDLLIELQYGAGAESASMLALTAPEPRGTAGVPSVPALELDPASGTLSPEVVDWAVEFAPLEIHQPGFVTVEFDPAPADPKAAAVMTAEGTKLQISLNTGAWQGVLVPGQELTVRLSSHVQVTIAGSNELKLAVTGGSDEAAASQIEFAQQQAEVFVDGIEFYLRVADAVITKEQLANVELESSNLLLALNAHEFSVQVEPVEELGTAVVRMRLVRNSSVLTDVSYALLADELLESDGIEVRLSWPELDQSLSDTVTFIKSDSDDSADPLAEAEAGDHQQ